MQSLTPEQSEVLADRFVTAVYTRNPDLPEDKKDFYLEVARKQLAAAGNFAHLPVTYENVYNFVYYIVKSSKILGPHSFTRFLKQWLNWPGDAEVTDFQKAAIFLANLADASHPDDSTIHYVYCLLDSDGPAAKTVWDLWCVAPQIIY